MRAFAALYQRLDRSTSLLEKRAALVDYFRGAPIGDAVWALWLLTGGKVGGAKARIASSAELREWVAQESRLADWLVEASYEQVGDLAETLALLLDEPVDVAVDMGLGDWIQQRLLPAANAPPEQRRAVIVGAWRQLPMRERFVFNKLLTGALRVGVSQGLVQQALAELTGLDVSLIAQRMLGFSSPTVGFMQSLLAGGPQPGDTALPYPFFLASALEGEADSLGPIDDWLLEWKWDGIRVQLIRRGSDIALWSRGEERMDGRFPEIEADLAQLGPDAVIDGELLAWRGDEDKPMPFTALQTRIQRRKPGPKVLAQTPVRVLAYDLLELDGQDLRE
ncbi:MAG: ATP-dependent DNA ligase, partial [Stenotrophomonas sp.]